MQIQTRKVKSKYEDIEIVRTARKWGWWRKLYDFAYRVHLITGASVREVLEKINEAFSIYEPGMRGVAEATLIEREDVKYTIIYAGCGSFILKKCWYDRRFEKWWCGEETYTVIAPHTLKC